MGKEITIAPQPGPQTKFLECPADIVIFGGSAGGGKSWALLMDAMRYCIAPPTPGYGAVLLRKSFQQIEQTGGLKQASEEIYPHAGAEWNQTRMRWKFPCGATVGFGHMEHEKDKHKYQGAEIPWIGFDELTHFTESQFFYLMSRNRSTTGVPSRIRATCNPDSTSWVAELIEWWIDQDTGFPIPERDGVLRWFVRTDEGIVTESTSQELWDRTKDFYGGDLSAFQPKTLTFIRSKLEDNEILMEKDPGYLGSLMQMPSSDRQRLLDGNWLVSTTEGAEWEDCPQYFDKGLWTAHWPDQFISSAMFIDPSKGKTTRSDPSAIVFAGLKGGNIYVHSDIVRRPAEQIVSDAVDMWLDFRPTFLGLEDNMWQELLEPMFDAECERRNIPMIPIVLKHHHEKKEIRIRKLGPFLDKKKLLLHKDCNGNKILYRQLKNFGIKNEHDDGPDALQAAIELLYDMGVDPMAHYAESVPDDDDDDFIESLSF